jgi:hypothetical protein
MGGCLQNQLRNLKLLLARYDSVSKAIVPQLWKIVLKGPLMKID